MRRALPATEDYRSQVSGRLGLLGTSARLAGIAARRWKSGLPAVTPRWQVTPAAAAAKRHNRPKQRPYDNSRQAFPGGERYGGERYLKADAY